ncbi:MAG: hypothetical protein K5891_01060 [Lachnospiraceae bacterium]|nr:hypothetical protein [Lachnospiraceae bacterium]
MKKKTHAPFLTMVSALGILSLLFGGLRTGLMWQSGSGEDMVKAYLRDHADRPFLSDVLEEDFSVATLEEILSGADPFVMQQLADAGDLPVGDPGDLGGGDASGDLSGEDAGGIPEGTPDGTGEGPSGDAAGEEAPGDGQDADRNGDPATGMGADDVTEPEGTGAGGEDLPAGDGAGDGGDGAGEDPDRAAEPWLDEDGLQYSPCTEYVTYEPAVTDSKYYRDRGLTALTTTYEYSQVEDDYFADAAFIGDSRMLGLHDYSGWKETSDFYCENGFSVYKWMKGEQISLMAAGVAGRGEKVDLETAFSERSYGKVYIMAGMNDLGYGDTVKFQGWMGQLLMMVRRTQPRAVIYLIGNLHISREKDDTQPAMNNINTNDKNLALAGLVNGEDIFYLDPNPLFCDEDGYLQAEITFDGYHLYAANYSELADFLREHAVVR